MNGWTTGRGVLASCSAAAAAVAMFYYLERQNKQAAIAGGISLVLALMVWRMSPEGAGLNWEIGVKDGTTAEAVEAAPTSPQPLALNADGKGIYPVDVVGWDVVVPPYDTLMSVAEAVEVIKREIPPRSYLSIDVTNGIVDTIKALREAVEPLGYPTISRRTDKALTMLSGPDRRFEPFEDVVVAEHMLLPGG